MIIPVSVFSKLHGPEKTAEPADDEPEIIYSEENSVHF